MDTVKKIQQNNNRLADELVACFKTLNEGFVEHLRKLDEYTEDAKNGYRRTLS